MTTDWRVTDRSSLTERGLGLSLFVALSLISVFFAGPATGQVASNPSLDRPRQALADAYPALEGLRFGLSVTDLSGNVLEAHRADERFMPASTAKLFVTAAALAAQTELSEQDMSLRLIMEPASSGPPTLVLVGRGDPTVGFGPDCEDQCLETLAKAVSARGIRTVGDIVGDDRWFAHEPTPVGWSWEDLKFGHGTAISALAVNENVVRLRVSPAGSVGAALTASWEQTGTGYFDLLNQAITSAPNTPRALRFDRSIGSRSARLYGALPVGSRRTRLSIGVDDPAHMAAWSFRKALENEGVSVVGQVLSRHRFLQYADEPQPVDPTVPDSPEQCLRIVDDAPRGELVATLPPPPLQEVVTTVNQDSQNLYAEVLLRQLGRAFGTGSSFCGRLHIETFLDGIGVPEDAYEIVDGSGLSNYNRTTPATLTTLLSHAATQPWAQAFRQSLAIGGGPDGTLRRRFRGTALEGRIFAKTGTLNHVDALSGYMIARSGRMLAFSVLVNDQPLESDSSAPQIDATLLQIAARH